MALLLGVVIAAVMLIITPGSLFYFDVTPKIVVLLAGTGVVAVAAAFSGLRIRSRSKLGTAFAVLLLLNLASLALSTVLSARPGLSLFGTNWRRDGSLIQAVVCGFAGLVAIVCAGRPERVRTVLRSITVAGAASALYGMAQYFGWDPLLPTAGYHIGEGIWTIVRPPGTLGYASYFATWLLFVVFLSLGQRPMEESRAWRAFTTATAGLAGFTLMLTGTRAAIVGLVVGGLIWVAFRKLRVSHKAVMWVTVAVVAGVGFYYSPPGQQMRSRTRWFAEDPWGGARLDLWRDTLSMAARRLPAGYGPEVFNSEFPRFESAQLARAYPDFAYESPHNMFLDTLVAQGLPGLLLLAALAVVGFTACVRARQPAFAAALGAGLLAQQFTAFIVPTWLIFLVTVALAMALEMPLPQSKQRLPWAVVATAFAAALLYCAVRLTAADHTLALAQRAIQAKNLAYAATQYHGYERWRLPGGTADIWYSRAVLGLAGPPVPSAFLAISESGRAALEATHTAEDPFNAWYNLAALCGRQNNAACVEPSLRAAIRARPNWFKPHWALAEVLRLGGRMDEAEREAVQAADLDAGKNPEVAQTLQRIRAQLAAVRTRPLQE